MLFAAPSLLWLAIYQWTTFGSPFRTGYSYWVHGISNFSLAYASHPILREGPFVYPNKLGVALLPGICPCGAGGAIASMPNYTFYPAVLIGVFWVFAPPLTPLIGLATAVSRRATPGGRYTLIVVLLSLPVMIVYFYQAARFLAPAASLLLIYTAVGIALLLRRGWDTLSGRVRWADPGGSVRPL
jgi:hypothetical protein